MVDTKYLRIVIALEISIIDYLFKINMLQNIQRAVYVKNFIALISVKLKITEYS
jgi:hypothetical protein